jgi:hypothetical protein
VTITRTDARLLHALASLAEHVPERMRAGHLAERARELAGRMADEAAPGEAYTPEPDAAP